MADTDLNATTLTVTITEALSIGHDTAADARDFAQVCTHTYASILNTSKRIFKLPNSNLNKLISFGTTIADGVFLRADVRYIRVTNLDGTAALQVGLDDGASDAAYTSVAANSSIMYTGVTCEGDNDGTTLDNATALKVKGIADQQIEVFIASV
tara:strand:- start:5358 stop:5819 length:462 start_codon:yes stop_codon:yes gene_type:complete